MSITISNILESSKTCSCKGIRTCQICEGDDEKKEIIKKKNEKDTYKIIKLQPTVTILTSNLFTYSYNNTNNTDIDFNGLFHYEHFLSNEEQAYLLTEINKNPWKDSQSGRKKQDYGVKVNYKKQKIKSEYSEIIFPDYITFLQSKLNEINQQQFKGFTINEIGNLYYSSKLGAHIEPHIDDVWIWGDRIIGINLVSNTILTFIIEDNNLNVIFEIDLYIKPGDLYMMSGLSRYKWKHCVRRENISNDRVVVTLREFVEGIVNQKM